MPGQTDNNVAAWGGMEAADLRLLYFLGAHVDGIHAHGDDDEQVERCRADDCGRAERPRVQTLTFAHHNLAGTAQCVRPIAIFPGEGMPGVGLLI